MTSHRQVPPPHVASARNGSESVSARVVQWPALPAAEGDGVYAVKVTGVGEEDAATAAGAVVRFGLTAARITDGLVIEGHAAGLAAFAAELTREQAQAREPVSAAARAVQRFRRPPRTLLARGRELDLRRPLIVGILNATPDSFYDGGRYFGRDAALARADEMVAEGAGLVEVGGESARPGPRVDTDEEICRVVPLIEALARRVPVPVSVDTFKSEVARRAVDAGAVLINDISGLEDTAMAEIAAASGAALVVMHIQGRPKVRQLQPRYTSVVDEVYAFLEARTAAAEAAGVAPAQLVIDPGLSFGKAPHHDVEIVRRLGEFRSLGYPIYLATSRKNYIRDLLELPFHELLEGTAAAVAYGVAQGASLIRTHDVKFMARLVRMMQAILGNGATGNGDGPSRSAEVETRGQA